MPDDEPTAQEVEAVLRWLDALADAQAELVRLLYGVLPAWTPEPVQARLTETGEGLLQQGLTPAQIVDLVARFARRGEPEDDFCIPGIVHDTRAFLQAVGFLAHLRHAFSLGEQAGLALLAGEDAAVGRRRRQQQRAFREAGVQLARENAAPLHARLRRMARQWWQQDPALSVSEVAQRIRQRLVELDADATGTSVSNIRRIIAAERRKP